VMFMERDLIMRRFDVQRYPGYPASLMMQDAIIILMPVILILLGFLLFG
jgi:hypothetical protein